ncbi:MAG: hypothetical protein J0L52_05890 [Caulobacterales bacterium]|nr:hypothetical protein [Caulobacterales bacterium]
MSGDVTLVLTSCGRFDLLEQTLESLEAAEPDGFAHRIIIEDSADEVMAAKIRARFPAYELIFNQPNLGQMQSIDRAYAAVRTAYVFHCEDDWRFEPAPFLDTCRQILVDHPEVSVACVRKPQELHPRFQARLTAVSDGVAIMPPEAHPEWFGYSFNPSLVRLDTWQRYGPFAEHGSEEVLSYRLKRDGFTLAFLVPGSAVHIGGDAHVEDPFRKARARGFLPKLMRSIDKRVTRLKRRLGAD